MFLRKNEGTDKLLYCWFYCFPQQQQQLVIVAYSSSPRTAWAIPLRGPFYSKLGQLASVLLLSLQTINRAGEFGAASTCSGPSGSERSGRTLFACFSSVVGYCPPACRSVSTLAKGKCPALQSWPSCGGYDTMTPALLLRRSDRP